jgi:hypothetical protein
VNPTASATDSRVSNGKAASDIVSELDSLYQYLSAISANEARLSEVVPFEDRKRPIRAQNRRRIRIGRINQPHGKVKSHAACYSA